MPQPYLSDSIIIHNADLLLLAPLRQPAAALNLPKVLFTPPVHDDLPSACGSLLHQHLLLLLGEVLAGSMAQ